jgi:hypothetical protein
MTGLVWDVEKVRIATDAAGIALRSWNVDTTNGAVCSGEFHWNHPI